VEKYGTARQATDDNIRIQIREISVKVSGKEI
jgi:hypothetical protein